MNIPNNTTYLEILQEIRKMLLRMADEEYNLDRIDNLYDKIGTLDSIIHKILTNQNQAK